MKKKNTYCAALLMLILTFCYLTPFNPVKAGWRKVYGYVEDGQGEGIEDVYIEAYINGFREDYCDSNGSGYYELDVGYIMGNTVVTLKLYPQQDFKDKVTSTTVTRTVDKRKDVTLKQFFALVVDGNGGKYADDALEFHNLLNQNYSFSYNNLLFLSVNNYADRDRLSSESNFEWAIDQIADNCSSIDEVTFWFTGHGWNEYFEINTDTITSSELDSELDQITCLSMYIFLGQCRSGSMIDDLNDTSNRAIYTSCTDDEQGNGDDDHSWWPWATIKALYYNAEDADDNSDLLVSLYELYDYAYNYIVVTKECYDQTPQRWIGSSINPDSNDYIGDNSYL